MKGAKDMAKSFSLVADKSNNIKAFIFSTDSNAVDEILAIYQEKRKDITVNHSIVDEKTLNFMKNFIKLNEKYLKDC
jgi:selenophosphate synthetase-related protein